MKTTKGQQHGSRCRGLRTLLVAALSLFTLHVFSPLALAHLSFSTTGNDSFRDATARGARLAVFDDVWQTIRDRYYDPALHGVDWPTLGATLRPLAAEARNDTELYAVLRRLVAALGDAHTRVSAPDERDADAQMFLFVGVGVGVRDIGGAFVVTRVTRGSVAWRGGVRPGDTLVSVDGYTASDLFARRLNEAAGASTVTARRERALSRLFDGATGTFALVVLAGDDGHARPFLSLPRVRQPRAPSLRIRRVAICHSGISDRMLTNGRLKSTVSPASDAGGA